MPSLEKWDSGFIIASLLCVHVIMGLFIACYCCYTVSSSPVTTLSVVLYCRQNTSLATELAQVRKNFVSARQRFLSPLCKNTLTVNLDSLTHPLLPLSFLPPSLLLFPFLPSSFPLFLLPPSLLTYLPPSPSSSPPSPLPLSPPPLSPPPLPPLPLSGTWSV